MACPIMVAFSRLPDPRGDRGKRHLLPEVIAIAVLALIYGAEHWSERKDFGHAKETWLRGRF